MNSTVSNKAALPFVTQLSIFFGAIFLCGTLSVLLGKDLSWDLANYHYYTPFAFLHDRAQIDYWPESYLHAHLIPSLDLLSYFLINTFSPTYVAYILGGVHGINLVLLFYIARFFLIASEKNRYPNSAAFFLAIMGIYGPTAFTGMGGFQNDNLVSIFVLGFVLLQLHVLRSYALTQILSKKIIIVSGIVLGVGVGLKLTTALYVIGAFCVGLLLPLCWEERLKGVFFAMLGVGIGVVLSAGYWMWPSWEQYHNPFFPFFNGIFHSPGFPAANWRDTRFLPQGLWNNLLFPFYFAWDGRTSDNPFQDFRFPIVYLLFIFATVRWIWKKRREKIAIQTDNTVAWMFLFFIFSYITWQLYFANMRYLVGLEMLTPLMIYLLIKNLCQKDYVRWVLLVMIFEFLVVTMSPVMPVRTKDVGSDYFHVQMPAFISQERDGMVLMAFPAYALYRTPLPQSYLIPFFPSAWRFVGVPFANGDYTVPDKINSLVKSYQGHFYLLTEDEYMPKLYQMAAVVGLKSDGACYHITSDRQRISNRPVSLCPVVKQVGIA